MDLRSEISAYLRHRARQHGRRSAQAEYARRVLTKLHRPAYHGPLGLLDALVEANSPTDEDTGL